MLRCASRIGAGFTLLLFASAAAAAPRVHRDIGLLNGSPARDKIARSVFIAFEERPSVTQRWLLPAERISVVVAMIAPVERDARDLERAGIEVRRHPDGSAWIFGDYLLGQGTPRAIAAAARLARVARIDLDGSPFGVMPALDKTAEEIGAVAAWRQQAGNLPLDGSGIAICDIDSGIDVFHPSFFRADGGYFPWQDTNGNGIFEPDTDSVDVGQGKVARLRTLNGVISYFWDPSPQLGSEDPQYDPASDWLYADVKDNGKRDIGRGASFDDGSAAFGEPLFVADDVNQNGKLDPGEKIVALKTSKIAAFREKSKIFERGKNLIDSPRDAESGHGTAVAGVLVGGQRGLTRFVGIANGADVIAASHGVGSNLTDLASFCIDHQARVVVHEYGIWWGEFLDGSGAMEALIDATSAKVAHATAAGNLATSNKGYRGNLTPGSVTSITVKAGLKNPYGPFGFLGGTLLWREPARKIVVTLVDPAGSKQVLPSTPKNLEVPWPAGFTLQTDRVDSKRGTARLDFFIYDLSKKKTIASGDWKIIVDDSANAALGPLTLAGFVLDDKSQWGAGIQFTDGVSEEHLVCYPATADSAITTAAYELNGYDNAGKIGDRAYYSGRGHRIDGAPLLTVSAPADPISPGYFAGDEARYVFFNGTSGATPHVAGTAALLLELYPELDGLGVRARIRKNALVDSFVGKVPNDDWGYGKLRTYRTLFEAEPTPGAGPAISAPPVTILAGTPAEVPFSVSAPDFPDPLTSVRVELDRDYDGVYDEILTPAQSFTVQYAKLGRHYLKLRATDPSLRSAQTIAQVEVVDHLPEPKPKPQPAAPAGAAAPENATDLVGRSCICSTPGSPGPSDGGWALAALALAAAARIRRRRV